MVLVSLVPALAIQAYTELDLKRAREAEVKREALRLAQFASGELDRIVDNAHGILTVLSTLASIRRGDVAACTERMREMAAALPQYLTIGAIDASGRWICASRPPPDADTAYAGYFASSVETGRFTIGERMIGQIVRKPVLPISLPYFNADRRVAGVVYVTLDLDWLAHYFAGKGFDQNTTLAITDRNGVVLVRLPENDRFAGTQFADAYMKYVRGSAPETDEIVGVDGVRRILGYVPAEHAPNGLYVGFALTKADALASVNRATWAGFILIGAGLTLGLIAAWIGARWFIARPVEQLAHAASGWAAGDLTVRANLRRGAVEFTQLGSAFDAMAAALKHREEQLHALNESLEQRVSAEIASRIKAEEAYRQAQRLEAVGKLSGGVAHDFNNLLQVIMGNLEGLRIRAAESPGPLSREDIQNATETALRSVRRGASITARLLAFAREQPLAPQPLDVNRLIVGMSDMVRQSTGESVSCQTVLGAGLWPAFADPTELESALLNLVVNARDAMGQDGKLTIETANSFIDDAYAQANEDLAAGQYVLISITDTGSGMPSDVIERAFDPFFTTKPQGEGTGLGLSQVYGFAKQSRGHVKLYSEPGHGTTVKLYLPRSPIPAAPLETQSTASQPAPGGGAAILVVEDDEDVRAYTAPMLRRLGYEVLEAGEGDAALKIIDARPDLRLLFTDVGLPGPFNGRQLADLAQQRRPTLNVLFTTGYARNAIVHSGRLDPGVALITKPYTYEALAARIAQILG